MSILGMATLLVRSVNFLLKSLTETCDLVEGLEKRRKKFYKWIKKIFKRKRPTPRRKSVF